MSFSRLDDKGKPVRYAKAVIDCSKDVIITEQSHVKEQDINNIIKKHGIDIIQKTAMMQSQDFQFDDVTGNDFQEASFIIAKAQQSFDALPSQVRHEFHNDPAEYLDYVQNPENKDALIERGWMNPPPPPAEPTQVVVMNPETPEGDTGIAEDTAS